LTATHGLRSLRFLHKAQFAHFSVSLKRETTHFNRSLSAAFTTLA